MEPNRQLKPSDTPPAEGGYSICGVGLEKAVLAADTVGLVLLAAWTVTSLRDIRHDIKELREAQKVTEQKTAKLETHAATSKKTDIAIRDINRQLRQHTDRISKLDEALSNTTQTSDTKPHKKPAVVVESSSSESDHPLDSSSGDIFDD